jgi:enoyl-[acyl-carrier-protein] reductase (NADH)
MEGIVKGKIAADIDRLDTMIQDRTIDLGTETIQLFKDVEQIVDTIQELDAQTARLFKELEEQLQGAFHIVGNDIDSMGMAIHAVAMAKATSSDGLTPPPLPTLEN